MAPAMVAPAGETARDRKRFKNAARMAMNMKKATKRVTMTGMTNMRVGKAAMQGGKAAEMIYGRRHSERVAFQQRPIVERLRDDVFSPDSKFKAQWDLLVAFLVLYVAFMVPFRAAFLSSKDNNEILILSAFVDVVFIIDIVLTFKSGFVENGIYCTDKRRIALSYIKGWLVVDLLASIPLSFVEIANSDGAPLGVTLSALKLLRMLRLARLTRILGRMEQNMVVHPGILRSLKILGILIFVAHWSACLWVIIGEEIGFGRTDWVPPAYFRGLPTLAQYLQALYWAFAVLFTFSVEDNRPEEPLEVIVTLIIILSGVYLSASIIGSLSSLLSSIDDKTRTRQEVMTHLFAYMKRRNLPKPMQNKLRDNIIFALSRKEDMMSHKVLKYLSPALKNELAEHLDAELLNGVWLFSNCTKELKQQMALMLRPLYYGANQDVFVEGEIANEMFFIKMGEVGIFASFIDRDESQLMKPVEFPRAGVLPAISSRDAFTIDARLSGVPRENSGSSLTAGTSQVKQDKTTKIAGGFPLLRSDHGSQSGEGPSETAITVLSTGSFFGESALLSTDTNSEGAIRNATVKTMSPCELLVLDKEKFEAVAREHPTFCSEIKEVANKRRKRYSIIKRKKQKKRKPQNGKSQQLKMSQSSISGTNSVESYSGVGRADIDSTSDLGSILKASSSRAPAPTSAASGREVGISRTERGERVSVICGPSPTEDKPFQASRPEDEIDVFEASTVQPLEPGVNGTAASAAKTIQVATGPGTRKLSLSDRIQQANERGAVGTFRGQNVSYVSGPAGQTGRETAEEQYFSAVDDGDTEELRSMLRDNVVDIDARARCPAGDRCKLACKDGTALHHAVLNGSLDMLRLLLNLGADTEALNEDGLSVQQIPCSDEVASCLNCHFSGLGDLTYCSVIKSTGIETIEESGEDGGVGATSIDEAVDTLEID